MEIAADDAEDAEVKGSRFARGERVAMILKTAMEVTADCADYADYAEEEGLGFLPRIPL